MTRGRRKPWWKWLLAYPTVITSLIGAVPQYTTWIRAAVLDVPWSAVDEAVQQKALWEKNFECSWKPAAQSAKTSVATPRKEVLTIIVCSSGDALVALQRPGAEPTFRWVAFDWFQKGRPALRTSGLLAPRASEAAEPGRLERVAQADATVICQMRDARGFIVRRIQLADGQCQEQVINPYTGAVVSVAPSPCTAC